MCSNFVLTFELLYHLLIISEHVFYLLGDFQGMLQGGVMGASWGASRGPHGDLKEASRGPQGWLPGWPQGGL